MTLAHLCDGDARVALNSLQNAVESARARSGHMISMEDVKEGLQRSHVQYDRAGQRNHCHLNLFYFIYLCHLNYLVILVILLLNLMCCFI